MSKSTNKNSNIDKNSKHKFNKLIKKIFNMIKTTIKNTSKDSPLVLIFIGTSLLNELLLRYITVKNIFYFKPFFIDIGIILIISAFSFLFNKKNRHKYLLLMSIIFTLICIVNANYFSYYSSFASFSLLTTASQLGGVTDAVLDVIKIEYFAFIWQPIFLIYIHTRLKKKDLYLKGENKLDKAVYFPSFIVSGVAILAIISLFLTGTDWSRFTKMWNRESVVYTFGAYTYQINDLFQSLEPKINNVFGHDKSLKKVKEYYENNPYIPSKNDYTNIFEGKNVIVVHAESFQTIAMDLSFNGQPVAPNMKKLSEEGLFFSNYYAQVAVGTSSDTEFTFSTSLMPSNNGTVFVSYFDRDYISIQKLFKEKGYYVFSMHGNNGDMWNRNTMYKSLGYDHFYSKSSYNIDETIGLGLSDKSFLKQSVSLLKDINEEHKNWYGTVITLTNHTPFSDLELMDDYPTTIDVEIDGQIITRDYINNTTLGNYIKSVHYADQALGQFIEDLDKEGLLENTVIVIYGDHDAKINQKYYNILYNYDPKEDRILEPEDDGYTDYNQYMYQVDKRVPFIIWTKDNKYNAEIKTPTGMIDALPTLGNMFGIHSDYQLGTDIMNIKNGDNTVVFSDGSYITDKIFYNSQKNSIYSINNEPVDESYIEEKTNYANEIIDISNDIINYDLIKELEKEQIY